MASDLGSALLIAATIANGLLAGASLDKALVQLPARRKIGLHAMAEFNRSTDLGPGLVLYPALGLGAPLLTIAAAMAVYFGGDESNAGAPWILLGALLSVGHMITTARAAPNLLRLRRSIPADDQLEGLYHRFAGWSGARAVLQVSTFVVVVIALMATH